MLGCIWWSDARAMTSDAGMVSSGAPPDVTFDTRVMTPDIRMVILILGKRSDARTFTSHARTFTSHARTFSSQVRALHF